MGVNVKQKIDQTVVAKMIVPLNRQHNNTSIGTRRLTVGYDPIYCLLVSRQTIFLEYVNSQTIPVFDNERSKI